MFKEKQKSGQNANTIIKKRLMPDLRLSSSGNCLFQNPVKVLSLAKVDLEGM